MGRTIAEEERQAVEAAWDARDPVLPTAPEQPPERLYVSIDDTTVHTREEGWKEIKVGAFYTTTTVVPKKRSEQLEVRAQDISFYADFAGPETLRAERFG